MATVYVERLYYPLATQCGYQSQLDMQLLIYKKTNKQTNKKKNKLCATYTDSEHISSPVSREKTIKTLSYVQWNLSIPNT